MSPPSPPGSSRTAGDPGWVGRIIAGRYRVDEVLGVGAMAAAYRAFDLRSDRAVVVKVPHSKHFSEEESRARFHDRVRRLLQIEHLHVIKVFDMGEEDGEPFAVLQHLAGGSLKAKIVAAGGGLGLDEVVPWLTQIADALDDLHARGEIHRDVKPAKILFYERTTTSPGDAVLADLGYSEDLDLERGTLVGTPAYLAPEQLHRESPATDAVDQYALATMVYQALSGQIPFTVASVEELVFEKLQKSPRPLSDVAKQVPTGAAAAVMRALAAEPAQRFPTCGAFARAFTVGLGAQWPGSVPAPYPPA